MAPGHSTRRGFLLGAAAVAGCLGDQTDDTSPEAVKLPDVDSPAETELVTLAHWFGGTGDEFAGAIRADLPDRYDVEPVGYDARRTLEVAVAEGLVDGAPPDCFQTVLGDELRRYVGAVTVHDIPDVMTAETRDSLRDGVVELATVEAEPYAVPVTVDRTNGLLVGSELLEAIGTSPAELSHPDDLLEALGAVAAETDATGLALPADGRLGFRLFCLALLGRAGPVAYEGLDAADVPAIDLRAAVEDTWWLLEHAVELVSDLDAAAEMFGDGRAATLLADRRVAGSLHALDATELISFPGTARTFVVDATGWCFPKRSSRPRGTAAVLEQLARPSVQEAIGELTETLPARVDANGSPAESDYAAALADAYRGAARTMPAASTGCGLDPDDRRWAVRILEPHRVREAGPEAIGDELLELFR